MAVRHTTKGWRGDSRRHALAARGISTGKISRRPKAKYSVSELAQFRKRIVDERPVNTAFEAKDTTAEILARSEEAMMEVGTQSAQDVDQSVIESGETAADIAFSKEEPSRIDEDEVARTIGKIKEREEKIDLVPSINEILPLTSSLVEDVHYRGEGE